MSYNYRIIRYDTASPSRPQFFEIDMDCLSAVASAFATAAQGVKADSAVQPAAMADVATTGAYSDLSGRPTLGTSAAEASTAFATAAQGTKADSALQNAAAFDASGAAATAQAFSIQRANHTGTQAWSTLTGAPTTLAGYAISDAYPLTGNPSAFLTSINSSAVTTALGFTPYNATNPSSYIAVAGARTSISITTTGTSGAATYSNSTGVFNIPQYANSGGTVTSITAGTGLGGGTISSTGTISVNASQSISTLSNLTSNGFIKTSGGAGTLSIDTSTYLTGNQSITFSGDATGSGTTSAALTLATVATPGTYSGVTVNAKGLTTAGTTRSFNQSPGRAIVSVAAAANGFQVSSTRDASVNYSVSVTAAVQIGVVTSVEGYVSFQICATNSSTAADWLEVGRSTNGLTIGLALALSLTQKTGGQIGGIVPAGYYARMLSVNVSGTPTYGYISGQEILL